MYFWEQVLWTGGGQGGFPFIKISSIKVYNNNIINNSTVALHLVFFQALPWNPKMKARHILLFPCYKLSNIVTGLTGPMSKESVDKQLSVPGEGYFEQVGRLSLRITDALRRSGVLPRLNSSLSPLRLVQI